VTHILTIGMNWFSEDPGGLNRLYAALHRSLERRGVAVRGLVVGSSRSQSAVPDSVRCFARREHSTIRRLQACRRAVRSALEADPAEVVAAHFSLYALPVLDLLRQRRFVIHFHGPWAEEAEIEGQSIVSVATKRTIESLVYRRADRFIVLSSAFAEILERRHNIPRDRIFAVPGGVDTEQFCVNGSRRLARERLHLPVDRPLIVSVRRLVHRVGLEGLIDAMAVVVRKSLPEALLLIAGRGALAPRLAQRIAARGLQQHVKLLDFVAEEDLPWLYRACDLSIVPSVALEGFGLSTLESLAAGTPVLVTPIGGLPETVSGLDPALVMPGVTMTSMGEAMSAALRDPGRLPSPEACTRYAREHFDWPVIARKVLDVYEQ